MTAKKQIAIALAFGGVTAFLFPGFNGIFRAASQMSAGESQIVASVLLVGAAFLWFMPSDKN